MLEKKIEKLFEKIRADEISPQDFGITLKNNLKYSTPTVSEMKDILSEYKILNVPYRRRLIQGVEGYVPAECYPQLFELVAKDNGDSIRNWAVYTLRHAKKLEDRDQANIVLAVEEVITDSDRNIGYHKQRYGSYKNLVEKERKVKSEYMIKKGEVVKRYKPNLNKIKVQERKWASRCARLEESMEISLYQANKLLDEDEEFQYREQVENLINSKRDISYKLDRINFAIDQQTADEKRYWKNVKRDLDSWKNSKEANQFSWEYRSYLLDEVVGTNRFK